MDQTNHGADFTLVLIGWATDGISLPLGFLLYATDAPWAEDARDLLRQIEVRIPAGRTITLLADRVHAGDTFLACLEELDWGYVIRLPEDTLIAPQADWIEVRHLRQRAGRLRVFTNVRIWKGATRRATVCLYRTRTAAGKIVTWYLVTNLAGSHTRFLEYTCRWWQECTHKRLKSALFNWERGRLHVGARVTILLMGFGCACWALWLSGRQHERRQRRKPSTTRSQPQRQTIIKRGWDILHRARKRRHMPVIPPPPAPRVLDYYRRFPGFRLSCDASLVKLW